MVALLQPLSKQGSVTVPLGHPLARDDLCCYTYNSPRAVMSTVPPTQLALIIDSTTPLPSNVPGRQI